MGHGVPRAHTQEEAGGQADRHNTRFSEKTIGKNCERGHQQKLRPVTTALALRPAWDLQKRCSHAWTRAEEEPGPEQNKHYFLSHANPRFHHLPCTPEILI